MDRNHPGHPPRDDWNDPVPGHLDKAAAYVEQGATGKFGPTSAQSGVSTPGSEAQSSPTLLEQAPA